MRTVSTLLYLILCLSITTICVIGFGHAQQDKWGRRGATPTDVLNNVAGSTNEDLNIQDTQLNVVTDLNGSYQREFKISNTLDSIRQNISGYLQWIVFIGLTIATILLIYNGFLLISSSVHTAGSLSTIMKRMGNIGIGVAVLLGFYAIIKVTVIVINAFTQN